MHLCYSRNGYRYFCLFPTRDIPHWNPSVEPGTLIRAFSSCITVHFFHFRQAYARDTRVDGVVGSIRSDTVHDKRRLRRRISLTRHSRAADVPR